MIASKFDECLRSMLQVRHRDYRHHTACTICPWIYISAQHFWTKTDYIRTTSVAPAQGRHVTDSRARSGSFDQDDLGALSCLRANSVAAAYAIARSLPPCGQGHSSDGFLKLRRACEVCSLDYSCADCSVRRMFAAAGEGTCGQRVRTMPDPCRFRRLGRRGKDRPRRGFQGGCESYR